MERAVGSFQYETLTLLSNGSNGVMRTGPPSPKWYSGCTTQPGYARGTMWPEISRRCAPIYLFSGRTRRWQMDDTRLSILLLIWLGAVLTLAVGRSWRRTPGTGLVLAYVLNLWMIHWLAPALYLLPWYHGFDQGIVEAGLEQSTYAAVAFASGSLVLTPFLLNFGILPRATAAVIDVKLPPAYVAIGAASYALLSVGVGAIPSATAIVSTGQQLIVIGLALCCWLAWRDGSLWKLILWLTFTCLLPFVTILTRGFIGYGAVAALTVLIFISGFIKPRFLVLIAATVVAYVGLSVFVTYMRDRPDIRETVWGGQPMQARLSQLEKTITDFEWFDISRSEHLRSEEHTSELQ